MLKSRLCNYNDVYILVSGTSTSNRARANDNAKRLDE